MHRRTAAIEPRNRLCILLISAQISIKEKNLSS